MADPPLSKQKSRYFCNLFAISSSLSPHAKQESDVSWQITAMKHPILAIRRLGTIANRKKVAARIDFLFLGSRDGFRDCAIGGMNIDVTLWAKWHGCGAGRSELGCSAGWTLGWVYWAATWNDAAPQVDIWNSAMFEFARAACLPISRTSRRVRGFQRRLRRSPLLRESRSLPRSAHRE